MKKGSLLIIVLCTLFAACSSMKNKSAAKKNAAAVASLSGTWVLNIISYPKGSFDSLYPHNKPTLTFDTEKKLFYGYSSCNGINGKLDADSNAISFKGDISMTLKACPGDGEPVFMENLKRVNKYSVSADGKELTLIQGDIALMNFHKK